MLLLRTFVYTQSIHASVNRSAYARRDQAVYYSQTYRTTDAHYLFHAMLHTSMFPWSLVIQLFWWRRHFQRTFLPLLLCKWNNFRSWTPINISRARCLITHLITLFFKEFETRIILIKSWKLWLQIKYLWIRNIHFNIGKDS